MDGYFTVKEPAFDEFYEKKSRFIGEIRPIADVQTFAEFIAQKKSAHWDASHNCFAYILKDGTQRYSDDGEPQGTAGMPILEVLRREGLKDAAVVVTRYFGGTLLGAGGLTRAYARAAKLAVDAAIRVEICRCIEFLLDIPYPLYEQVRLLLQDVFADTMDTDFGAGVVVKARIRAEGMDGLSAKLTELSSGGIVPCDPKEIFAQIKATETAQNL